MKSARRFAWPPCLLGLLVVLAAGTAASQEADEDEIELPDLRPGLVATYTVRDGTRAVRRDESLSFNWHGRSPDPRLPAGDFSVVWQGKLFALAPGRYQLHVHAEGEVALVLAGRTLFDGPVKPVAWIDCPPVKLEYGYHPLEVEFRATGPQARFGLYWSGPQFQLEPVSQRHLFHDPEQDPGRQFEQGRLLARRLACAACHDVPGEPPPQPGPALTHLAGNINRTWLVEWLRGADAGGHASRQSAIGETATHDRPARIMPLFAVNAAEAEAMADYLLGSSEQPRAAPGLPRGDSDSGGRLFHTLGCLACHASAGLGTNGLFGGGDLSAVGDKRPGDFFKRWLHDPASVNPAHRMPVFKLSDLERADLAAYLATLKSSGDPQTARLSGTNQTVTASKLKMGVRLVEQHRCGACHALPEGQPRQPSQSLGSPSKLLAQRGAGCMGRAEASGRHPGYNLPPAQQDELREYFEGIASIDTERKPQLDGRLVLAERGCLSCHARGLGEGITSSLAAIVEAHPELSPALPAMSPPSLSGVGDKLDESALADAITLRNGPLRPWLSVRMPRYELSPDEMKALVDYFVEADRIPSRPQAERPTIDAEALGPTGARLVTSDGFGCTSCHQIGKLVPSGVALAAQGTDLSMLARRVRKPWFDRWVRNPARIVSRIEMPAVQQPVRGVLGDSLDDQLAAIWQVLNQPGFNPPLANPIRVVRARNVPEAGEPAAVLSDVLEMDAKVFVKPLAIGLPNRHNALFDLASNRLAGWWIGDTARQRTRGKSWYWEAGGKNLLTAEQHGGSELVVLDGDQPIEPVTQQQFLAQLDRYEQVDRGVRFSYRLRFATASSDDSMALRVTQTITASHPPGEPAAIGGLRRRMEIEGLPPGTRALLRLAEANDFQVAADGSSIGLRGRPGQAEIRLVEPAGAELTIVGGRPCVALPAGVDRQIVRCELEYLTTLPLDQFPFEPPELEPPAPVRLGVVPGYEATRLPLPTDEMPTGLAWRDDGTLVFSSLKGSVWLAHDTDGDGLEDRQTRFADGLAAPYGVATHGKAVDVITKHGLVRLSDHDADGRAERIEVVASGWGHTADYHDWAVGLERDEEGNYYIALPCQQDERSPEAAYLRGTAIKLIPRQPTPDDPRSYAPQVLCAGLRFPMGLALNRRGDLFATDNQGNYNPFNELNHLVSGARYGFINKVESRPGFAPPFRDPAIDIPHPWTRSVNGICFLYTPLGLGDAHARLFGPFEGHLIGCEYDTRRLVRMSLELVDGVYQGAVYPFSLEPAELETFEGPVVCQVARNGDLYVGNLRDSGWGAGQNTGSLVRLKPHGPLPAGIAEVRARPRGFELVFTAPVRRPPAQRADSYAISSYRKVSTADYGGPDVDRRTETIRAVDLAPDGRSATVLLGELRAGFVYELRLKNLAPKGQTFFPSEAYYTMRVVPK